MLLAQVAKRPVVGEDIKGPALQIRAPFVDRHHHGKELFLVHRQLLIADAQSFVEEGNGVAVLDQDRVHADVAGIRLDGEGLVEVRQSQQWSGHYRRLEHVEHGLCLLVPREAFLREQLREGLGDDVVARYKLPLIACQARESAEARWR